MPKAGRTVNVKRLDGALLNFWVAKAAGLQLAATDPKPGDRHDPDSGFWHPVTYCPAQDWSHAGTIISEEWFAIEDALAAWFGPQWPHINAIVENPLKWFMRAYVATQFGDEVEDMDGGTSSTSHPPTTSRVTQWLTFIHR
jgi:Protein of unknown function (DUF2591)